MNIMNEVLLEHKGLLQISGQNSKVVSKLPWSDIKTTLNLNIHKGKYGVNSNDGSYGGYNKYEEYEVSYEFSGLSLSIFYEGILITFSPNINNIIITEETDSVDFHLLFNIFNVGYIESLRQHDIEFVFKVAGGYTSFYNDKSGRKDINSNHFTMEYNFKFSESDWINVLSEMGYNEKIIIAIDRPKLEGYHEVMEFIEKANKGLTSNASPDEIIKNLRASWNSMKTYLKTYHENLRKEINGYPKNAPNGFKSDQVKRIEGDTIKLLETLQSLENDVRNLTNIGAHPETYTSNREDAVLAFRLTVSLMSYYSGILKRISDNENADAMNKMDVK